MLASSAATSSAPRMTSPVMASSTAVTGEPYRAAPSARAWSVLLYWAPMRNGFKVFDADAHVIYPPDLWSRFLDEALPRPGRPQGAGRVRPLQPGHRRRPLHPAPHVDLGQFQKAINWTTEDMIAKYGDIVTEGFTGDRVADALEIEGVDVMVIYGPEYDMWLEGIDPELQAAMARAYNRWGAGDARDVGRRA